MKLTDDQKKMLTEFLGECWHEMKVIGGVRECCCGVKGNIATLFMHKGNRTFLTPDDQQACKDMLVEKGMWAKFYYWAEFQWADSDLEIDMKLFGASFNEWLFRPVDEYGEPHFCRLVAEFLEGRK